MKKITIFLLALMMTVLFVGCNGTPNESVPPSTDGTQIKITVGDDIFTATLADNQSAEAFAEMLPLTLDMSEMNGNEKYHYLDEQLPTDSYRPGTIREGDLLLYGPDCLVLFYETFSSSYSYTRIGWVNDTDGFAAALGKSGVTVTFELDMEKAPDNPNQPEDPVVPEEPEQPGEPENPTEPEEPEQPGESDDGEGITLMYIYINGNKLEVALADNSSVTTLIEILKQEDIIYNASDYGGFEKVGSLGHTLPTNHTQISAEPGDVILYGNNQIVLFYGMNSWSYTRLGKIKGYSTEELRELLGGGRGDMQVRLSLQ